MLLDRDAITTGAAGGGGPFEFYDLGHGYCSYTFFEQCPHRMACARCDFYIPKASSEAQLLEAKHGLQRMLVQIPLTDDERAAVEGDQDAVDRLLDHARDGPNSRPVIGQTEQQARRCLTERLDHSRDRRGDGACAQRRVSGSRRRAAEPLPQQVHIDAELAQERAARSSSTHTRNRSSSPNCLRCSTHARRPATVRNICSSRSGRAKRGGAAGLATSGTRADSEPTGRPTIGARTRSPTAVPIRSGLRTEGAEDLAASALTHAADGEQQVLGTDVLVSARQRLRAATAPAHASRAERTGRARRRLGPDRDPAACAPAHGPRRW